MHLDITIVVGYIMTYFMTWRVIPKLHGGTLTCDMGMAIIYLF
jgi:hypothetical protein